MINLSEIITSKKDSFHFTFLVLNNGDKIVYNQSDDHNYVFQKEGIMILADNLFFIVMLFNSGTLYFTTSPTKALQFLNESYLQECDAF